MSSHRAFQNRAMDTLRVVAIFMLVLTPFLQAQDSASGIRIVVVSGENTEHRTGHDSVRMPLVRVEDTNGQPVSDARVLFILPEGGPGGAFLDGTTRAEARTNTLGLAAVRPFKLNSSPGEFQIQLEATWQSQRSAASIHQRSAKKSGGAGKKIAIISAAAAGGVGLAVAMSRGKNTAACPVP